MLDLKIQNQISITWLVLVSQEENCTGRYSKGLKNQNGEYLVNLCASNILEIQVIFLLRLVLQKFISSLKHK